MHWSKEQAHKIKADFLKKKFIYCIHSIHINPHLTEFSILVKMLIFVMLSVVSYIGIVLVH